METQQHTPGPWKIDNSQPNSRKSPYLANGAQTIIGGNEKWNICEVMGNVNGDERCPTRESLANAHLIAAAPDLLEALKAYRSMVGNTGYAIDRGQAKILYDKATILIEKSKGGSK